MEKHQKIRRLVLLSMLITIIIVLAFTPLGYIKTLGLEITLLVVPVVIGAINLGPKAGAILGLTFGLSSFIQCFGLSEFGVMLFSINPWLTAILCILPRTLMGFLVGVIFKALNKICKKDLVAHVVACVSGALLNTILFMTFLCLFFYNTAEISTIVNEIGANSVIMFIILFVGINGLVEAIVNFIVGTCISKTIYELTKKYE